MMDRSESRTVGLRPRRLYVWLFVPVLLATLGGCRDYHWTSDYQRAEEQAREQKKYLFVFYKWWLSSESNRMHGDVLADKAVGGLFRDTVNVLLERDSSPEFARYMSKYGVAAPPAFVIAAPDGSYQVRTGYIPKDRFIEFVQSAKTPRAGQASDKKVRAP